MPPVPLVSALDDHLGYRLRLVSNHVSASFARRVEAEGVTVAEWVVLRFLYDVDAMSPSALAGWMNLTRGAISKLADRLLGKELVERIERADDGRAHTLRLAKKGRALVPRLARLADLNDTAVFDALDASECAALERILDKLIDRHRLKGVPVA